LSPRLLDKVRASDENKKVGRGFSGDERIFSHRNAMDTKTLLTVFTTVFVAELGDKAQLTTLLFASDREVSRWTVFIGAALALIVTSAFGVLAGGVISQYISEKHLHHLAGIGFVTIGVWTIFKA